MTLINSYFKLKFISRYIAISFCFLSVIFRLQSQILPTEDFYDFESMYQQKNIRISERIKGEWNLHNSFIQQTYYNANKDTEIDSVQRIKQVLSIHYLLNNSQIMLELIDDGKHFDKKAQDGIYGNILIGDFNEYRTDESIIDIQFDTIGINYSTIYPPVNYLPKIPVSIIPQHNSIISSVSPEISFEIDPCADGCRLILLGSVPIMGEELKDIIWEKEYKSNTNAVFIERIPVYLLNNKEYTLIILSYTNTKHIGSTWNRGAYSMEWSRFYIDTLLMQEDLILLQNYPNPFNSTTIIKYILPSIGMISIIIYDIIGREITTLVSQNQSQGEHYVIWDGRDDTGSVLPSGTYFYTIRFNGQPITKKILLIR